MDVESRIECALMSALVSSREPDCPPRLADAVQHAVFPGGARIRPKLCLAVAASCGASPSTALDAVAASLELLHCASLVHDDLPCFDNADLRRGRASVHKAFGERLAVLAGDALIVTAFSSLAEAGLPAERLPMVLATVGMAVGMPAGIVAGQAWECEDQLDLQAYQQAKTGALFAAACMAGAAAAGHPQPRAWATVGQCVGEAYQVFDDLRDVQGQVADIGKPVGRDQALGRPNVVHRRGVDGAHLYIGELMQQAVGSIPECVGKQALGLLIRAEVHKLVPKKDALHAA